MWPGGHVLRLDLRSLALLRVAYGVIIALDVLVRMTDLRAHYSDFGVLGRHQLLQLGWNENWFSLHLASGSLKWTVFLFLTQLLCALALIVGWRTRWVTALSWILLISLHARNPMVLNGGDVYLRCMLFWGLVLPWGHRWSWDAKKGSGDHSPWMFAVRGNSVAGMAALAVLIQVANVYWFAALPKTDPSWMVNYTATELALQIDQFVTPFGHWFREHFLEHLRTMTFLVITWEALGPFLFFFPFDRGQIRTLAVFGFVGLHAGFGTMMELGFFAWIGAVSVLVLLPAWFWDVPLRAVSQWADERFGRSDDREDIGSGKYPRELLFFLLIVYCFTWNLTNESVYKRWRIPPRMTWIGYTLRVDQRWNMFSPGPFTEDGWFVIEGRFADGRVLDLFNGGKELTWEKPERVQDSYKNQRWRKYFMNLWLKEHERYRLPYGQYLSRKWNKKGPGPEQLSSFDIVYMLENTNLDGTEAEPEKKVIWEHWCFEVPDQKNKAPTATDVK